MHTLNCLAGLQIMMFFNGFKLFEITVLHQLSHKLNIINDA